MDRRESPRIRVRLPGTLTVLATGAENPSDERSQPVLVNALSGNGASVQMDVPLRVGALVKLVVEDDLFLGEVVHCGADEGGYLVGLHLDCALASLSGIRRLMLALFREGSGGDQEIRPRESPLPEDRSVSVEISISGGAQATEAQQERKN